MTSNQPADFPRDDFAYTREAHIPSQGPGDGTKYARDLLPGDLIQVVGTWREVDVVTLTGEEPQGCHIALRPMTVGTSLELGGQGLTLDLAPEHLLAATDARLPYVPHRN